LGELEEVAKNQDKTKVTRITASDAPKPSKEPKVTSAKAVKAKNTSVKRKRSFGIFGRIGGYFKGAWVELRQVHWPTRSATWGLTGAVLLFAAFFVVFITLLDAGFKYVFEQILR
jgi:preprotein translocase subunit SecE